MKKIFALVLLTAFFAPAIANSQTYQQRANEGMLPDRLPSSSTLQMFRFGGGNRVGEEVYVTDSNKFKEYTMSAVPLVEVEKNGIVKVELKRTTRGPVYLDSVRLVAGKQDFAPIKAIADGKDVTRKLVENDKDAISFEKLILEFPPLGNVNLKDVNLMFTATAGHISKTVSLPDQKSGKTIVQSSQYYNYLPGSQKGSIVLDGTIDPKDELGKPSYRQKVELAVGSGKEPILMWVRDDGANLSVTIEVVADNTLESDDQTVLYVRGRDGMKTFTAGTTKAKYGRMGSAYTEESKAEHRVYEFVIPFSQLPQVDDKGKWEIAFGVTI